MNRLDSSSLSLIYSSASRFEPGLAQRLLVLIPDGADCTSAMRRISDLAHTSGAQILFLGLCKSSTQELSLRRQLVTLSALFQDARVCAESKIEIGTDWVDVVKSNYRDGDMIVCFAEQRGGLLHRPLSQMLQSNLRAPIYILSGLAPQRLSGSSWRSQALVWAGSLGIIIGFFFLQIQITSVSQNWIQTMLLTLSVVAETWLVGAWNSLFG